MPTTELAEEQLEVSQPQAEASRQDTQAAVKIAILYKGVRLKRSQTLSSSKKLSGEQKEEAARLYGADADRLSMSKKLYDCAEPKVKAYRKADAEVSAWFKDPAYTLPWPEGGMRQVKKGTPLLDDQHPVTEATKRDDGTWEVKYRVRLDGTTRIRRVVIDADEYKHRVRSSFQRFKTELLERIQRARVAAAELEEDLPNIRERQRKKLGRTFNPADYQFNAEACNWQVSFPVLSPDPELAEIDPETFREEEERFRAERVESIRLEKVRVAEQLLGWLDGLASALSKRELLDHDYEVLDKKVCKDGDTFVTLVTGNKETNVLHRSGEPLPVGERKSCVDCSEGDLVITFKNDAKKETVVLVEKADIKRRLRIDDKARKFNTATASRLFSAMEEARQRKEELGISSPSLDRAFEQVGRMVRGQDAETLPENLREDEVMRQTVEQRCVTIASSLFEASEIVPRRAVLRKKMNHPALKES